MHIVLAILGLLIVGAGLYNLSNATMGAGVIAAGCFLAIVARMVQASEYQSKLLLAVLFPEGERSSRLRTNVQCPSCGKLNRVHRKACRFCQADLRSEVSLG